MTKQDKRFIYDDRLALDQRKLAPEYSYNTRSGEERRVGSWKPKHNYEPFTDTVKLGQGRFEFELMARANLASTMSRKSRVSSMLASPWTRSCYQSKQGRCNGGSLVTSALAPEGVQNPYPSPLLDPNRRFTYEEDRYPTAHRRRGDVRPLRVLNSSLLRRQALLRSRAGLVNID